MALQILLNGQTRVFDELDDGATISGLTAALGVQQDRVAIELNGSIVPRKTWDLAKFASGDRVEMVHFVGGGSDSQAIAAEVVKART